MRSYYCGELNESHVDEEITLCGGCIVGGTMVALSF